MEKIEKMRALAMAGELRGGQSHTVEVVVSIVFIGIIGSLIIGPGIPGIGLPEIARLFDTAIRSIQDVCNQAFGGVLP